MTATVPEGRFRSPIKLPLGGLNGLTFRLSGHQAKVTSRQVPSHRGDPHSSVPSGGLPQSGAGSIHPGSPSATGLGTWQDLWAPSALRTSPVCTPRLLAAGTACDTLNFLPLPPRTHARAVSSTENPTRASGGNARRPQPGAGARTPWPRGRVSMAQGLAPERWADGRQAAPTPHSAPRARSPCAPTSPSPPSRSLARDGERPVIPPDLHPCSTPRRRGNCRRLWLDSGTSAEAKAAGCGEKPTASPPPRSLRPARLDRRARHGFRGNAALPDAGRAAAVSLVWPSDPVLSCQPTGCARIRDAVTGEKHPILATWSFQDPEACSPLGGSRLSPADTEKSPSQPQTGHTTTWTVVGKGAAGVSVLQVF